MAPDPDACAARWAADWNAHDLDRILSHYAEDVTFRSLKALALVGAGALHGKPALRAYWAAALARQPDLHFTVERAYGGHDMVAIAYRNQRGVQAMEMLRFGTDGLVQEAAACHAAA